MLRRLCVLINRSKVLNIHSGETLRPTPSVTRVRKRQRETDVTEQIRRDKPFSVLQSLTSREGLGRSDLIGEGTRFDKSSRIPDEGIK